MKPYKVFVVDDEKQVRERIIHSFPWQQMGLSVIGAACDGKEALQMIEREPPHLVLTDIRMPVMDGLELAHALKSRFPEIKVAILSAFDDFHYAQEAIRAGVKGYLLKPLAQEEFVQLFQRLVGELDQELLSDLPEDDPEFVMTELINGSGKPIGENRLHKAGLGGLLEYSRVAVCSFGRTMVKEALLLHLQRAARICTRFWSKHGVPTMLYGGSLVLFFHDKKPLSKAGVQGLLTEFADHLESFGPEMFIRSEITIGVGNLYRDADLIHRSYNEALFASSCKFFRPSDLIFYYQDMALPGKPEPSDVHEKTIEETVRQLFQQSPRGSAEAIDAFFRHYEETGKYDVPYIHSACMELLVALKLKAKQLGRALDLPGRKQIWEHIQSFRTLAELKAWIRRTADPKSMLPAAADPKEERSAGTDYVTMAKAYVQSRLAEKITLEDVADYLYINTSYFSHLFKKQTGQNFIDYVNEARVKKAAELIRETNYRIKDISLMVGYSNFSYFNKVFKSIIGVKPLLYRSGVASDLPESDISDAHI